MSDAGRADGPDAATEAPRPYAVLTLGETMALLAPDEPGPLRTAQRLRLSTGGAESNVAIGLARLGLDVTWLGRVGDDELGARVLRDLRAEGVRTLGLVDPEAPTALMIKEPQPGERVRIRYHRRDSAGSRLLPTDLPDGLVASATVLHVTGITPALSASAHETIMVAVEQARAAGTYVSLDVNLRRTLWSEEDFRATLRPLVEQADLVFGGTAEVAVLTNSDDHEPEALAAQVAGWGPGEVVIKGGVADSVALIDGELHRQPSFETPVINTVGAGDAYVAGYLYGKLVQPHDVEPRLVIAAACGALACTAVGDWEAAPTRAELNMLLLAGEEDVVR